jgi:hypothetical protein
MRRLGGPAMLGTLRGIGDSLMCGLQGYDLAPQESFFAHLCRAADQAFEAPRLRWGFAPFRELVLQAASAPAVEHAIDCLRRHELGLVVTQASSPTHLFAVPGFSVRSLGRAHEDSRGTPHHLRPLAAAFLNPERRTPASAVERALAAPPAQTYVLWLGGVDWISALLGARQRVPQLGRRLLVQTRQLGERLLEHHQSQGWAAPRIVLGGLVDPTRLPLVRPSRGSGDFTFAFLDPEAAPALPREARAQIRSEVEQLNRGLAALLAGWGGVFVDLDRRFAEGQRLGEAGGPGWRVPIEHFVCADHVHPTATGSAIVAHWFTEAIAAALRVELPSPPVAAVWAKERSQLEGLDEERARPLVRTLYQEFLYRPGEGEPSPPASHSKASATWCATKASLPAT